MPSVKRNLLGQKLGRKGSETRQRIVDVTLNILKTRSYSDLSVADIAGEAELSSSTFYVYFKDVEDVLYHCVLEAAQDLHDLHEILDQPWTDDNVAACVREFVMRYNSLWEQYRVELRVRNLEADQGNFRFLNLRIQTTQDLLEKLSRKITQFNPALKNPRQIAIAIHAAMGSLAAQHDIGIASNLRQSRKKLQAGVIEMICTILQIPADRS